MAVEFKSVLIELKVSSVILYIEEDGMYLVAVGATKGKGIQFSSILPFLIICPNSISSFKARVQKNKKGGRMVD